MKSLFTSLFPRYRELKPGYVGAADCMLIQINITPMQYPAMIKQIRAELLLKGGSSVGAKGRLLFAGYDLSNTSMRRAIILIMMDTKKDIESVIDWLYVQQEQDQLVTYTLFQVSNLCDHLMVKAMELHPGLHRAWEEQDKGLDKS